MLFATNYLPILIEAANSWRQVPSTSVRGQLSISQWSKSARFLARRCEGICEPIS